MTIQTKPCRFAFYGRLSTTDKQDPALSFPSQRKACERKAAEVGGKVVCEFTDQESGAKQDREGWGALTHEAQDLDGRRFDAVLIYSTSRLARDRLAAALFERELRKVGVAIHYATGAGDPETPEGQVFIGMQQLWDEFERNKLARETKRGMREISEQGYRAGGQAPFGYRRKTHALPEDHRGDRDKARVTLEPVPGDAEIVGLIFDLYVHQGVGLKGIAERLNAEHASAPQHPDRSRNSRRAWAASTIRSILRNPVYTGRIVWNRLDFATARQNGGTPRLRPKEEWVVTEDAHLPIASDETFEATQAKFENRTRRVQESSKSNYLFAGIAHCCAGHNARSMQGKRRKGHAYYACNYGADYGETEALDAHAGQKWIYLREDALLPLVERFFEQRIFGPMRLDKLEKQLSAQRRSERRRGQLTGTRLRQQVAETDRKLKVQIQALEDGMDAELVSARIAELRTDKETFAAALAEIGEEQVEQEDDYLSEQLARIPDLTETLRAAPPEVKRQTFDAFDLRIDFDKAAGRIEVSATVSQAVADAFESTKALQTEGFSVAVNDIAGAGFEPATFGL